ncbi:LD-carboxypeptidase [uncultured Aquitalea sp.]|uniref:S66 peptidase family protein n=1 Tax=uncultured Aquitalea sp. TaxID=540272 RepID=UPI0025ECC5FF|nr:LD-carboxypeptidase [uncultured Aquitalea sp.]
MTPITPLPNALGPGAHIAIIAPAGPALPERRDAVLAWLTARGMGGELLPGVFQRQDYLSGPDEQRLADLHMAFAEARFDAVFCLRGGYGTPRLLPNLDLSLIARHPKPFVGYSDITALHIAFNQAGLPTFHGPMLASDLAVNGDQQHEHALFKLLAGKLAAGADVPTATGFPLQTLRGGKARGPLLGGNLALVAALAGTPWALRGDGAVLFLEDVGEEPYRIDRMLNQLKQCGLLGRVAGVILGDFALPQGVDAQALAPLWQHYLLPLGVPVLAGWRSGHCFPNMPLPLGVAVELDADAGRLTLLQDIFAERTPA